MNERPMLLQRYWQNDQGATIVEFAIVSPILFGLIFIIVELGIIYHIQSLAIYAGNEAARVAKTGRLYQMEDRETMIRTKVQDIMRPWFGEDEPELSVECYNGFGQSTAPAMMGCASGQVMLLSLHYSWPSPVLQMLTGHDAVSVDARALVKNENF